MAILLALIILAAMLSVATTNGSSKKHGSSRFLTRSRLLNKNNKGFCLNGKEKRLSLSDSFQHVCVIAPTGQGKTTTLVAPNIALLEDSFVCIDLKSELTNTYTSGLLNRGFEVIKLDLKDAKKSAVFNILKRSKSAKQIRELAANIMQISNGNKSDFWVEAGTRLLSILIQLLHELPQEGFINMANLLFLLKKMGQIENQKTVVDELVIAHASEELKDSYLALRRNAPNTLSGIIETVATALSVFDNHDARMLCSSLGSGDSFDFSQLRKKKIAIFIGIPLSQVESSKMIVSLFMGDLFNFLLDNPPKDDEGNVFMLLEEAGNFRFRGLSEFISTARSHRVGCMIVLQSIQQMTHLYGAEKSANIVANANCLIALPGISDLSTLRLLTEVHLGKMTFETYNSTTDRVERNSRNLLNLDELKRLKSNTCVLSIKNELPLKTKVIPIYKNKRLMRRAGIRSVNNRLESIEPVEFIPREDVNIKYIDLEPYTRPIA